MGEENLSLNDFVVLYRTNAQSRAIEEAFLERRFPIGWSAECVFMNGARSKIFWPICGLLTIRPTKSVLERIINLPARGSETLLWGNGSDFHGENNLDFVASAKKARDIPGLNEAK